MTEEQIIIVEDFIQDYFSQYTNVNDSDIRNYISDYLNTKGVDSFCDLTYGIDMYLNTVKWDNILSKINTNERIAVGRKELAEFLEKVEE